MKLSSLFLVTALSVLPAFAQQNTVKSTIETVTGPVTTNEVRSFKAAVDPLVPGESNRRNSYSYGYNGDAMEALGDMYDITGDRVFLDKLILFCDKVVSIRNTHRVMWTGNIDPIWPNNTNNVWGCEQGDVAGHLAYCAQLIARDQSLWNAAVGIGDTNGHGKTYKARATRYLSVVDETMELFYQSGFIRVDDRMITPAAPLWPDPRSANDAVPWNQQSMITSALVRSADAHALFGDRSPRIDKFRRTATRSIERFIAQCNNYTYTRNGKTVCKWSYSGGEFKAKEPIRYTEGIAHGGYDITALWRASHWLPGSVRSKDARMLADTLMEVIRSDAKFWSIVDGTGSLKHGMKNSWAYLAEWRPDVFAALVKPGEIYYADAARYLWIKNAMTHGWRGIGGPKQSSVGTSGAAGLTEKASRVLQSN